MYGRPRPSSISWVPTRKHASSLHCYLHYYCYYYSQHHDETAAAAAEEEEEGAAASWSKYAERHHHDDDADAQTSSSVCWMRHCCWWWWWRDWSIVRNGSVQRRCCTMSEFGPLVRSPVWMRMVSGWAGCRLLLLLLLLLLGALPGGCSHHWC